MGIARQFTVSTSNPNQLSLNWLVPIDFNNQNDELIITRTPTHFPSELFNAVFPTKATDSRPIEIFRGRTIAGTNTGTISVSSNVLTDSGAAFPTSPNLNGRLIRDSASKVHRILSNTATTITVDSVSISNGKYVVLSDFPVDIRVQDNFEFDIRTVAGNGFVSNLVVTENAQLILKTFERDELNNLLFQDSSGTKFIIKSNTEDTVFFYENTTPTIGTGMSILSSFSNSQPLPYTDTFKTDIEAAARVGTGLLDNNFYYYTLFTIPVGVNVAQAEFADIDSGAPTQAYALSTKDRQFGALLYSYWPELYRTLDTTEDLEDLMEVFGFQFNFLHALIDTYRLQDYQNVLVTALLPLSEQTGLPGVGFSIGADTLRRIAKDMINCWKLKGSKEGIALFIREITTWDITDGTADFSLAIQDLIPNVAALRFFDDSLGSANTRITSSDPFVSGGRFARSLPGIVIPGFFTFREFVITIPDVALFVGSSETVNTGAGTTTITDNTQTFGTDNSLVGNYLLPNQEEVNDIFRIVSNTNTTITVEGILNNRDSGGRYCILSPLNANRFIILNRLLPFYIPFGTKQGYDFV